MKLAGGNQDRADRWELYMCKENQLLKRNQLDDGSFNYLITEKGLDVHRFFKKFDPLSPLFDEWGRDRLRASSWNTSSSRNPFEQDDASEDDGEEDQQPNGKS